jgi:hypothetical protein
MTDPAEVAAIMAEFLRQVYLADRRLRQARMAGLLPVPPVDPLGLRLLRFALPERARHIR